MFLRPTFTVITLLVTVLHCNSKATSFCNWSSCWSVYLLILLITFQILVTNAQKPSNTHVTKHQSTCNSDKDCDSTITFLRCAESKCQCPIINLFDEELNRCSVRVGGVCEVGSKTQFCVAHADCQQKGKGAHGVCKCKTRYEDNINGVCVSSGKKLQTSVGAVIAAAATLLISFRLF
ncbi:hypothetical protein Ocin01_06997 [Orchesella cincta]|uniref:Uncharacterized protein n=1 Tax=Orchesella cincta TaxID=48709 RepID=A0A1D2N339_ORCCI|nr:hypothetical protein Ocin01_06997 [Orchesella cincta]